MSNVPFKSERINDYLLGSVSAEEAERLDELSITDAEFAQFLVAAESELIDGYVLDELDEETRRKFESSYLSTPAKKEKVAFAETFQQFGQQRPVITTTYTEAPGWFSQLNSQFGIGPVWKWGFATAALALLVATLLLAFQNTRLRSELSAIRAHHNELAQSQQQLQTQLEEAQQSAQSQVQTSVTTNQVAINDHPTSSTVLSLVLSPMLRGGQQKQIVTLNRGTTAVTVRLVLEPNDLASYRVELLPHGQAPVWRAVNLKAQARNGGRSLVITLPVRVLKIHDYILRVSGSDQNGASEVLGEYPFAVKQPK